MNDRTYYHDISEVDVPADKIAFLLEKVASGSPCDVSDYVDQGLWLPPHVVRKMVGGQQAQRYECLTKLAEMEKTLPLHVEDMPEADACLRGPEEDNIAEKLKDVPV
jgi:hypothetical protein